MWKVAADYDVPIVVPFLSGPNPREMDLVRARSDRGDGRLLRIAASPTPTGSGCASGASSIPGTGFAPSNWPWEDRFVYQKQVYSNLDELRRWGLPLYIALPWKETAQHDELLDIVVRQRRSSAAPTTPPRSARSNAARVT